MANNEGTAIAAAGIQSLGNYVGAVAANRKQFKYQKEAMALQQGYNKDLWDYQNAYNTPQAQMERLTAAGLNPHLIYGSGSAGAGNAGPIAPTEAPVRKATDAPSVPDAMLTYLQVRQADQQYQATKQNMEIAQKRSSLMDLQTSLQNLKLMSENARSKNYKDLAQAEIDTKKFVALKSAETFANERRQGDIMDQSVVLRGEQITAAQLDNEFKRNRNQLAKLGLYSSDDPKLRVLVQAAHRMGIDLDALVAKGFEKLKYLLD